MDAFNQRFAQFTQDRIRPAIDLIGARKRSGLLFALLVGAGLFVIFALAIYLVMMPYQKMMGEHKISYWPLMLLAPASLAMIAFTLVYILSLRNVVKEFRESLINRITEFVDPGLVHEGRQPVDAAEFEASALFDGLGKPVPGIDRFRGRSGSAAVEFCDVHVPLEADGKDKNAETMTGIFMKATYPREFKQPLFVFPESATVSRSGIEAKLANRGVAIPGGLVRVDDKSTQRQILKPAEAEGWGNGFLSADAGRTLNEVRAARGSELYLGAWGGTLYLAFLSRSKRMELPGAFEGFDFGNCREFCREASAAMALTRELDARTDLWK